MGRMVSARGLKSFLSFPLCPNAELECRTYFGRVFDAGGVTYRAKWSTEDGLRGQASSATG
jgi:hypothetical protein